MLKIKHQSLIHSLIIVIAAFIVYSNTFHVPFQLDDQANIKNNPLIQNPMFLMNPSLYCSKISPMTAEEGVCKFFRSRYFGYLTFALNYRLHGTDVRGYHIVNLGIHIFSSLMVYLLVLLTFQTPFLVRAELKEFADKIAFFTGLIFTVHPV
jgi:protein O-mannosyl-transferase